MINVSCKDPITTANYHGFMIGFLRSGAYCDLTAIAKLYNKRVDNWTRLENVKELLEEFKRDPVYRGQEAIVQVRGNLSDSSDLRGHLKARYGISDPGFGGTWAHPDIAIQFAQWCNPAFALWVSRQVRHLLTYGEVNVHISEWNEDKLLMAVQANRDDINEMYLR